MANDWHVLHQKYLSTSTSPFALFNALDPSFEEDPSDLFHKIVDAYNERLQQNRSSDQLHQACYTLLCYQYQWHSAKKPRRRVYRNPLIISNLRSYLFTFPRCDGAVLRDISILQLIFYLDIEWLHLLFVEAITFIKSQIDPIANLANNYSIIDIFLDATILRRRLFPNEEQAMLPVQLMDLMKMWFCTSDEKSLQGPSLTSLFLKTIVDNPTMTSFTWRLIADSTCVGEDEKLFTFLYKIIDTLLAEPSPNTLPINLQYCMDESILFLISYYLGSNAERCTRHVQHILNKMIDYLRRHSAKIPDLEANQFHPPFVFSNYSDSEVEKMKNNYFLLLDNLGNDAQVILSKMPQLETFMKTIMCDNSSSNRVWLRCIFSRLLTHDNQTIIKEALCLLLRMNAQIFDRGFISLLVKSLNHLFLYDNQDLDAQPQVARQLSELFVRSESAGVNITSNFVIEAAKIEWTPIPLLYVLESLTKQEVERTEHNNWSTVELQALLTIVNKWTTDQAIIMKVPTQINVLKCIVTYVKPPLDFVLLGRIFASMDADDVLARGNATWEMVVAYFKQHKEGLSTGKSILECSHHLLNTESDSKDIRALAILSVFMVDTEDVSLIASITSNILCPLFTPMMGASKSSYENSPMFIKALQLMNALMKLSPHEDDNYVMFVFGFLKFVFDKIMKKFWKCQLRSYEEAYIHIEALATIRMLRDTFESYAEAIDQILEVIDDDLDRIVDVIVHESTPLIRAWYALNILHVTDTGWECVSHKVLPKFDPSGGNEKTVSECYGLLAHLYQCCVEYVDISYKVLGEFLSKKLLVLAKTKSHRVIVPISAILQSSIFNMNEADWFETTKDIVNVCWEHLWKLYHTPEFWACARGLTRLLLCKRFLHEDKLREFASDKIHYLLCRTEKDFELRYMVFTTMQSMQAEHIFLFRDVILWEFLQINEVDSTGSIEMQTGCHITKEYSINSYNRNYGRIRLGLEVYSQMTIRSVLVALILKMNEGCEEQLAEAYIPQLTSILENQKRAYPANGSVHKIKLRVMQILLCIRCDAMYDRLSQSILGDNDEPSVRILNKWILILLYVRNSKMKEDIWRLFVEAEKSQPEHLTSLLAIVHHVAKCSKDDQFSFAKKAIEHVLPATYSQHVLLRLYSMVVLSELFKIVKNEHKGIKQALYESLQFGNVKAHCQKLLDTFYFKQFQPMASLSLQTIFYDIPRLTGVCRGEWIRPEIFEKVLLPYGFGLAIYSEDQALSKVDVKDVKELELPGEEGEE